MIACRMVGCVQWVLRWLANIGVWSSSEGILGGFSASRGWLDFTEGPSVTKRFQSWRRVIHSPNHNFVLTRTRTHSARSNSTFIRSCQIKKIGKNKTTQKHKQSFATNWIDWIDRTADYIIDWCRWWRPKGLVFNSRMWDEFIVLWKTSSAMCFLRRTLPRRGVHRNPSDSLVSAPRRNSIANFICLSKNMR